MNTSRSYPITIGLVAGESSGDILGAGLMRALRQHTPEEIRFVGSAGPRMREEGIESWYDIEELAVMGIIETFNHLPRLLRIRRDLEKRFIALRPDVFVGIDAPDFTISLERRLKQFGIRTIHYVSPSVWAWRKKRIFKIKHATDNVLLLFPFEKKIYDHYHVSCQFIGHTLADTMPLYPDKNAARKDLSIPTKVHCLALLPGSRQNEIKKLSADFLRAAELVKKHFSNLEIIVSFSSFTCFKQFSYIKKKIAPKLSVRLLENKTQQAIIAADAALLASGTVTLECMLAKCPMVVGYRMNPLTFLLAKKLIKIPWISLPNILAGYELVKELLQEKCRPDTLAPALIKLLDNSENRATLLNAFCNLHQKIRCNADQKAARAVLSLINR